MSYRTSFVFLALAVAAAPLSAQIVRRAPAADRVITRTGGDVARSRTGDSRTRDQIPPGHLPPRGMCRVWIDGQPPGQQPPVTDCATAERNRVANARVIYGDRESFPGRGKGATRRARNDDATNLGNRERRCSVIDGVVVDGRVVDVCRDERSDRKRRGDDDVFRRGNDDDDDDDDRLDKREKREAKALRKANKERAKAAAKQARQNKRDSDRG